MPTMKNNETGEEREVSMEELMAAIRDGNASIQQQVHHADGTITSSTILGNNIGDGIDRSVNIFATMNDVLAPAISKARKIKEADENAEILFCIDDSDVDYEITIDDLAIPVMHIVTCTKENIRVARYIRDERKTVGTPTGEITIAFEDGKILATLEEVQNSSLSLFAFGAHETRQLLKERGILQELQELGNIGSGVIITTTEDSINAKVVRGYSRPELPCMMFGGMFAQSLDDAIMMRPYVDELLMDSFYEDMSLEEKIEAAEDGDMALMEELALVYLNGDDEVEPDPEKAVYWFTKLAELDFSDAQFNLGLHCAEGCGIERSFEKAVYWFERAAENGDEDAPAIIEKIQKAVDAEKIVSSGDAQAQADLAQVYMFLGNSLSQADPEENYTIAFDYAQKSAAQNNGDGIWALALAYEHGRGVEQDTAKAVELYRKGAELGHAPSQHSFACYLFRGDFLEQDNEKAFELCMKSAEQGYGLAMADVGRCYQFGNGVTGNMKTAVEWYEKSLEVIHDPELERKVEVFKMIGADDENWGEDYSDFDDEDFEDEDFDDEPLPDSFFAVLDAFGTAQEYELELAEQGILPDAPIPGIDVMNLSLETFPRIALKVEEGDRRALDILAKFNAANELD